MDWLKVWLQSPSAPYIFTAFVAVSVLLTAVLVAVSYWGLKWEGKGKDYRNKAEADRAWSAWVFQYGMGTLHQLRSHGLDLVFLAHRSEIDGDHVVFNFSQVLRSGLNLHLGLHQHVKSSPQGRYYRIEISVSFPSDGLDRPNTPKNILQGLLRDHVMGKILGHRSSQEFVVGQEEALQEYVAKFVEGVVFYEQTWPNLEKNYTEKVGAAMFTVGSRSTDLSVAKNNFETVTLEALRSFQPPPAAPEAKTA